MSFYDTVLRELVLALGAALLVANLLAMARRRRDGRVRATATGARSAKVKGSSRVATTGRTDQGELVQAPIGRSVAFAVLGFVMLVAGIASLTS